MSLLPKDPYAVAAQNILGQQVGGMYSGPTIGAGGGYNTIESRTHLTVEKLENGYVINANGKSYIAPDIDGIIDVVKLALVTAALT